MVVVDNGSGAEVVAQLRLASNNLHFHLIANERNLGIATALNIGCRWAISQHSKFLLLFDQDSEATENFVGSLLRAYQGADFREKVGLVGANVIERRSGASPPLLLDGEGRPMLTLTSGSLIRTEVFEECGRFEDDLFIDYVDHEYCLRIRSRGYRIMIADDAILRHDVGFPRIHKVLGIWSCCCVHHAPGRRYYYARNLVALLRRYWETEPVWCRTEIAVLIKSTVKALLFEGCRIRKLWLAFRGILDGASGRMGQRVKL